MNCVILDDEPFAHQVLEHYINETPGLILLAKFRNAVEAYEYLNTNQVDLLFLDIEMPLIDGISFLKALKDQPKTIFTTAYKQYAFEGFELGVIDYLLKPFSYERFKKAIQKLDSKADVTNYNNDTIAIKDKEGLLNLKQQDILYVEGCKDYIKIVTQEQLYVIYHTLKAMLGKLNHSTFLQVHRSYIVNKIHVERIMNDNLILSNQTFIPISQSYKKTLLTNMNRSIL